jgi:hypothetical protein
MSVSTNNARARLNPQVLHVGFSKCASTYLRAMFRAQPRIHLVFKSGYFTPFLAQDMTFAQYQSLFSNEADMINVESDEHLVLPGIHPGLGVRSTNIEEFEAVADRIQAQLPDVNIMMVIRNQASLIVSRYSEFLITGGSLAFDEFASRMTDDGHGRNLYFQNYYSRIIEILEKRFPRENLLILTQEAMREDSIRTSAAIASFLSLDRLHDLKKGLRSERRSLSSAGLTTLRLLKQAVCQAIERRWCAAEHAHSAVRVSDSRQVGARNRLLRSGSLVRGIHSASYGAAAAGNTRPVS